MNIDTFRIILIIVISLVILALIIIGIILLIKWFRKPKNKNKNGLENSISSLEPSSSIERQNYIPQSENNNIQEKTIKKDYLSKEIKINAFCNCFLKPVKYSLVKVYNESCPIDLIPFSIDSEVSVTKCLHAFHFNCIKKYLLENEENNEFKCPICLTVLLDMNPKI